jgi:adenine-specific DNA-methyltransferase
MTRNAAGLESSKPEETNLVRRKNLGQFFTPDSIADLMASMFGGRRQEVRLLDAGAGAGALTAATVRMLCKSEDRPAKIAVTAYEIDTPR